MMTFDELWPVLGIPGEFDAMDQCDQMRWRGVLQQAFDAGQADAQRTAAVWENEAREQALQALASEGQWIEQTGALQRRIAELEAQRQWQPIETAPMDGQKVILFYLNRNNFRRTVMARWVTDEQAAETDADDVGLEAGWYECIDNWDDYCQVCIHEGEPTHWMPLPPPPVERAHGIEEAKR